VEVVPTRSRAFWLFDGFFRRRAWYVHYFKLWGNISRIVFPASYEHVPQLVTRAASNLVAGPSTKRKNAPASTDNTGKKPGPVDAIAVSSDEEVIRPTVGKRGRVATGPGSVTNGRSVGSKGKGKATTGAPVRRRKAGVEEKAAVMEETTAETDIDIGVSPVAAKSATGDGIDERMHSQLVRLRKKLDDVRDTPMSVFVL
jgi:hypothetical protein